MISKKVGTALNQHLANELESSLQYLAMASWCDKEGLEGSAKFFYAHADEEHTHFMKIFHFINDVGGHAIVPQVEQPTLSFKNIEEICEMSLSYELKVTKSIHKLMELALKEDDHVTAEFLRFFVEEQKEEEILFQRVMDKIKLIGKGGQSLYYIDQELGKVATQKPEIASESVGL